MEKLFNWVTIALGVAGGFVCNALGGWDVMLKTILILAVLDYITGVIKAFISKEVSSAIGFLGIFKKALMFIMIAVTCIIQELIGEAVPLREIVIVFYIANEGLSILENAAEYIPIPEKIKDTLLQLRNESVEDK